MSEASVAKADDTPPNKFVWRVNNLKRFKNAALSDNLHSKEFTIYGAKWVLGICPNGESDEYKDRINLYLRCNDLNGFKDFECDVTLTIDELSASKITFKKFTGPGTWGLHSFCSHLNASDLKTLTIECTIVPKRIDKLFQDLRKTAAEEKSKWISAVPFENAIDLLSNKFVWTVATRECNETTIGSNLMSSEFMMYGVKWRLEMYPKGRTEEEQENISLYLHCIDLNAFQNFHSHHTITIRELAASKSGFHLSTKPRRTGWVSFCSNADLWALETITIECTIVPKELKMIADLFQDTISNQFLWRINDLNDFNDATIGDEFNSEEFTRHGVKWQLELYPKGDEDEDEGNISLYLTCLDLNGLPECACDYTLAINELNASNKIFHNFTESPTMNGLNIHPEVDYSEYQSMTIVCTIVPKGIDKLLQELREYIPEGTESPLERELDVALPQIDEDDADLYQKHNTIISEWDKDTDRLKKLKVDEHESSENDEKQGFAEDASINEYFQSQSVIKRQMERLNVVETDEYLAELTDHRSLLLITVKQSQTDHASDEKEYDASDEQCRALKEQRERLLDKIKSLMTEYSALIKRENEAIQIRDRRSRDMNQLKEWYHQVSVSSEQCTEVISRYTCFMEDNKRYIKAINARFDVLWSEIESKWMEWKTERIIAWFKYKTVNMDTSNVDWETVEKQLKKRNITGKLLQKFNELTFEFLEIHDYEVVKHLLGEIEEVTKQQRTNEKSSRPESAPGQFLCPISKRMMRDPVVAFDGHSYERSAIEEYLKTHGTSPKTGKEAEYVIVFPNHRLRADIEAYIKERKGSESTPTEGENETSLL